MSEEAWGARDPENVRLGEADAPPTFRLEDFEADLLRAARGERDELGGHLFLGRGDLCVTCGVHISKADVRRCGDA